MDIAKFEHGYQSIVPIGAVTNIQYYQQQKQQRQHEEKKEHPFQVMFQMQLRENTKRDAVYESYGGERPNFQAYC